MKNAVRILETGAAGFRRSFAALRAAQEEDVGRAERAAHDILAAVQRRGDAAVLDFTERFDGVRLTARGMRVDPAKLRTAAAELPRHVAAALRLAARRIRAFHARQRQASWRYRDTSGVSLGQNITPLRRVGVYVPGGHAAYPSSVLMNVIPARVAGVAQVVMVSPAGSAGHAPAVLAAAHIAGVDELYQIGGAQAVAALAYGTRTVARVDKIVGPGNAFVQAAKRQVYGTVDIDSTAGPSEVLVIADTSATPAYVAADLLAQAEHGSGDESAILLTPSKRLATAVQAEIAAQVAVLPRRAEIERVLRRKGALIVTRDLDEAIALAEEIAPEHLEVMTRRPEKIAARLRNAGAIFLGDHSPAPLGDYMAGPNHVLPTGGSARFFSPLGTYDFVKRTSIVAASPRALRTLAPAVETLAKLEGYDAHAAAVRIRGEKPRNRR